MLYLGQLMILFSCVVTLCLEICPRPFPAAGRCWALQVPLRQGWSPRGRAGGSWQRVGGDGGHGAMGLPPPQPTGSARLGVPVLGTVSEIGADSTQCSRPAV